MSGPGQRLQTLLSPVVEAAGLDLEDVSVSRAGARSVVRVVVDGDRGLDLDAVAEVSSRISAALDDADNDVLRGAYVLEVTSPGVDRPLTAPRHWSRAVGRLVSVRRREGGAVVGRVVGATDSGATLTVDGTPLEVPFADVAHAVVQVEFTHQDGAQ